MTFSEPLQLGIDYERIRVAGKPWKYRTLREITMLVPLRGYSVETPYFTLDSYGMQTIAEGYAWDGATVAWDTSTIIRASLGHDAVYQALREGLLMPDGKYDRELHDAIRIIADDVFIQICRADGMHAFRRWYCAKGLQLAAGRAARPLYLP